MANNENLIPIPGRLHSVATEGHVSGADEIYDDTQQKDQATINSELIQAVGTGGSVDSKIATAKAEIIGDAATDYNTLGKLEDKIQAEVSRAEGAESALDGRVDTLEEAVGTGGSVDSRISAAVATETTRAQAAEADRYTKAETYNKNELNNMITTPNQEYVSVIATAQTTAVTDVLPATGAADTTYRVGNWDGTQYNDSVFSEYAWNGSAYIKLSTKSQVGEVYDISANHADTKYADLAAALGTNGANIPQSLRKGGMSVKFVQSSDNKYVQYRLMSDTFSTTESDWQGVDDEPTAGSENLVKSGGVHTRFNVIEEELGLPTQRTVTENVLTIWVTNGYVCYRSIQEYVEGKTYYSSTTTYSDFIDVSKYRMLKYINMKSTTAAQDIIAGVCFYSDANEESVISGSGQGYAHGDTKSFYENEIAIPAGAKYVRFSCFTEFINDFYCKGIYTEEVYSSGLGKKVEDISDDVETIKETLHQQEIRIDPVLCRRRFYLAMTEWCKSHNLSDSVIIEGAGGGGIGGEVEDEQVGHGLAQYKVGDAAKILFNAYSYDFIANACSEKVHIAYPKGATEGIELIATSYDFFESILPNYIPMVWKGGTGIQTVDTVDENYCNLCAICNNEDFNGNLVLGVIRSAKDRNDRYVMFKALMDIARKLINNDQAISSEVETLINAGQGTNLNGDTVFGNAIAIKIPVGNPKAFHKIDFNDTNNPHILYSYNADIPIKAFSMIKLLTAIITLDYINDLDVFLTVTAEDKASVGINGSGYNLFPVGCKLTIRDLLYAALLPSNNVACYVLARYVGQHLIETYGTKGFIPEDSSNE